MKRNLLLASTAVALTLAFAGCTEFVDAPVPTVGPGQCEFHEEPYNDKASAQSAMVNTVNKLSNVGTGGKKVVVTDQRPYETSYYKTKKGKKTDVLWGYQVVFNCSNAEIKFEAQKGFKTQLHAENALNARKFSILDLAIAFGGDVRFLSQTVKAYERDQTTQCYDVYDPSTGYYYTDCDTTVTNLYKYDLAYAIVKNDGTSGRLSSSGRLASNLNDGEKAFFNSPRTYSSLKKLSTDRLLSANNDSQQAIVDAFAELNGTAGLSSVEVASKKAPLVSPNRAFDVFDGTIVGVSDDYAFFKDVLKALDLAE